VFRSASTPADGTEHHQHDDGAQNRQPPGPQIEEVPETAAEDQRTDPSRIMPAST
jgi:hypothetical protein